jgi:hypothetical protein
VHKRWAIWPFPKEPRAEIVGGPTRPNNQGHMETRGQEIGELRPINLQKWVFYIMIVILIGFSQ